MDSTLGTREQSAASSLLGEAAKLIENDPAAAAAKAREAIALNPSQAAAYRLLGASLRLLDQDGEANAAELKAIELSGNDADLVRAVQALKAKDYKTSELILRAVLASRPNDVLAIQTLGEVAAAAGALHHAEALYRRALKLAPGFEYSRLHLANVLKDQGRPGESLCELRFIRGEMLEFDGFKMLLADVLSQIGECDEAADIYRGIRASDPSKRDVWSRLTFLLNSVGKGDEAIETCRAALKALPDRGHAWWSLANLKTYRFNDEDLATMEQVLADPCVGTEDRIQVHFALGKALEDLKEFQKSFDHYRRGNELRASQVHYHPESGAALLERVRGIFTKEFLELKAGQGNPAPDPIFIVGMPRAGSTLVEQILASHPLIEGTAELPDLHALATALAADSRLEPKSLLYLDRLEGLSVEQLRELGGLYLERTRIQRRAGRPFFVDKMPSNWAHIGFIKLILPNAKIIDVRRHPLACGFSNYKQLFGRGQEFSYDLAHIGSYYRHYVAVMAHFDLVAPRAVYRVIHEQLVMQPEKEIRRLLDYIGVPFDEACVRFHETQRSVRTPSSQQVRQPLRAEFAGQWKAFESELDPLKDALGPALQHWNDPQPN